MQNCYSFNITFALQFFKRISSERNTTLPLINELCHEGRQCKANQHMRSPKILFGQMSKHLPLVVVRCPYQLLHAPVLLIWSLHMAVRPNLKVQPSLFLNAQELAGQEQFVITLGHSCTETETNCKSYLEQERSTCGCRHCGGGGFFRLLMQFWQGSEFRWQLLLPAAPSQHLSVCFHALVLVFGGRNGVRVFAVPPANLL